MNKKKLNLNTRRKFSGLIFGLHLLKIEFDLQMQFFLFLDIWFKKLTSVRLHMFFLWYWCTYEKL